MNTFRAPGFSMKREAFAYAYPILRKHGIDIDVSIVPAARDHGGVAGFTRDPFLLDIPQTKWGPSSQMKCWPVSVMDILGRTIPFSGGGYLRLFPMSLVKRGYRQNHAAGRPGMSYIHPARSIQPSRGSSSWAKGFAKYYVGIKGCEAKLRETLRTFKFTTISEYRCTPTFGTGPSTSSFFAGSGMGTSCRCQTGKSRRTPSGRIKLHDCESAISQAVEGNADHCPDYCIRRHLRSRHRLVVIGFLPSDRSRVG